MTIYIDLLLILNFIYDFLLLMTVSVTLKIKVSIKRLLLTSFLGALSTFIIFIPINNYLLFLLKILVSMLLLYASFGYKNMRYFLNTIIYFYMSSVILAGFIYFLKIQFQNLSYILILIISPIILYMYKKTQDKLKQIVNYQKEVIITLKNNKVLKLTGFIDTGNRLRDPITHKYIILINKNKLKGIYNIRSPIYVAVNAVNSTSLIKCISIKNIIIDNKVYTNYLLGLSDNTDFSGVDCLLNYQILMEE